MHWSRKLDWYSNFILIKSTLQYTHCITRHDIIGWNDLYITRWYQISNVDVIGFLSYSCAFCQESDGAVDWLQLMFSKAYLSPLSTRFYDRISSSFYKIYLNILVYIDNINHRKGKQSFQTGRKARIHRCMFLVKMHIVANILDWCRLFYDSSFHNENHLTFIFYV